MTKPNLPKLLKKWTQRLRLQDWDIDIKYIDDLDGGVGQTEYSWKNSSASITILDPSSNKNSLPGMQSVELTLVHELVHLMLLPGLLRLTPDNIELLEYSVEKIAKSLYGTRSK